MRSSYKILFLFLFNSFLLIGQNFKSDRDKLIVIEEISFKIDSFSIVSSTLKIKSLNHQIIPEASYNLNEIESTIEIIDTLLLGDTLMFSYQVYPVLLSKTFYNRKLNYTEPKINNSYINRNKNTTEKRNNSNLIREGNVSRNIMIGNSQDLSILSNIDLRINGKLNNDISIQSVISDNNLPFQEDGSSYKLQEFDKVFIRIFNEKNEIITGDIVTKNNTRFLKYNRKAKGIILKNRRHLESYSYSNLSSISMSKGKYTTQSFNGDEGNQGPYKLKGRNGENYIVVLSGTEKLFMNGVKLERGIDKDYIIDYNTAEIIFTSKNLISKDDRFYLEFEYNERSYAQSVVTSHQKFVNKNLDLSVLIYSELDWKNQNYLSELSDSEKHLLSEIGDSESDVYSLSVDSTTFSEEKILYKKIDTMINNINLQFYRHSNNPDSAIYQIRFTEVNQNEGDYILKQEGVNGKTYEWIPPIFTNGNFISQGNFTPYIKIICPKSKTIISTEALSKINNRLNLFTNITLENFDKNLFSNLNDKDNNSLSTFLGMKYKIIDTDKWKIINSNSLEFISDRYNGINTFKDIEFSRYWNCNNFYGNQTLYNSEISILKDSVELLKYIYQNLNIGDVYSAYRNSIKLNYKNNKFSLFSESKLSKTKSTEFNSTLLFSKSRINYNLKYINLDLILNSENFQNKNLENELLESTNSFVEIISSVSNKHKSVFLEIERRKDYKIFEFSKSSQVNLNLDFNKLNYLKNSTSLKYKNLDYSADSLMDENHLLSSNDFKIKLFNNFIQFNKRYELGKGKQSKKEKSFIKVPSGMGTHNWIDNNSNGIQELNEFSPAVFQDEAEYVILLLPSNQLEDIYFLDYKQSITADLNKITKRKILKKIYIQSLYQVQNKNKDFQFNPFYQHLTDSSIEYMSQSISSFSYNRNNKFFNLHFQKKNSIIQNSFSYGTDRQKKHENQISCNNLIINNIYNKLQISLGKKENFSNFFNNKNYEYSFTKLEQHLDFEMKNNSNLSLLYIHQNKQISENNTQVKSNEFSCIYQKLKENDFNLQTHVKFINIDAILNNNSILNYELMEGLSEGCNFIWGIRIQKKLKNSLQIDLLYDGRKSTTSDVKHVGNIGVTAFF